MNKSQHGTGVFRPSENIENPMQLGAKVRQVTPASASWSRPGHVFAECPADKGGDFRKERASLFKGLAVPKHETLERHNHDRDSV